MDDLPKGYFIRRKKIVSICTAKFLFFYCTIYISHFDRECYETIPKWSFLGITISIVRKYSGGYHAKKVWICHFFSVVILIGCFILFSYIQIRFVFFIFETGAVISLSILSPIQSTDHTLDQSEKTKYKKVTAILAIGCEIFEIILAIFGKEYIAKTIGTGIMVVALLQWPCILKIK